MGQAIINSTIRKTSFLPLRDAVLCADCNFVSADEEGVCPVCRGRALSRLAEQLPPARHRSDVNQRRLGLRGILQILGFRRKHGHSDFAYLQR